MIIWIRTGLYYFSPEQYLLMSCDKNKKASLIKLAFVLTDSCSIYSGSYPKLGDSHLSASASVILVRLA